jgi:hypothetical protein
MKIKKEMLIMDKEMKFVQIGLKNFGKAAMFQLSKKDTYLTAGAVAVGAFIGSKSKEKAIQAGTYAMIGMVGFAVMHLGVPKATDEFMEWEESISEEE